MSSISLTVTSDGGRTIASVSTDFETAEMLKVKASGSGTSFLYPNAAGGFDEVVVSETLSAVRTLMSTVSTSAGQKKQMTLLFDATGGKAIGTYALVDFSTGAAATIPNNSRITRSWYDVITTFTSATDAATIAMGAATDDAAGIKAAIAISNAANPYDAGLVEGISLDTAATTRPKTTAARAINAVVAVEALTAGKLALVIEYTTF